MIIRSACASFGKLEKETLQLHEGLNIINAPNESGKSTWCAFIRAMLYGIDTSERSRLGYIPDKVRYSPWSGAPMEGSMKLTAEGCDIEISRTTRSPNAPMKEFRAYYEDTGDSVEELNGSNAGEMLTGVSKDVFRRSAFIEQGTIAVTGSSELEKRISTIVSSGEEAVSFSQADEKLKKWKRKRRYNRNGKLPEIEAELDRCRRELAEAEEGAAKIEQAEAEIKELDHECEELEGAITEARKRQRKAALEDLSRGSTELDEKLRALETASERLAEKKEALRNGPFGDMSVEDATEKVEEDVDRCERLEAKADGKRVVSALPFIVCFVISAVCATIYTRLGGWYVLAGAVLCLGCGIFLAMKYVSAKNTVRECEYQRKQIFEEYHVSSVEDMFLALETHRELSAAFEEVREVERAASECYAKARREHDEVQSRVISRLDFSANGSGEASAMAARLRAVREKKLEAEKSLSQLKGRLESIGGRVEIESEIRYLEDRYDNVTAEYEAIELAETVMAEADRQMQNMFSPKLGALAAEYMSQLTGGKYNSVLISKDFTAMTKVNGDTVARQSEYLSAGTLDLLYLAVRLAVCELALPEGKNCPLIIDDALVNLDEERKQAAMELLRDIARSRQVILFTCK